MINRYTVIGQPVAHSLSPIIHQVFGDLTQRKVSYSRTEATNENFDDVVEQWQSEGGRGCNVTLPFKERAVHVCTHLSGEAERSGAVNTIAIHADGTRTGHNTDGLGLLADLRRSLDWPIARQRVLLIGAGGAARGVVGPLLAAEPSLLHIVNRTSERAVRLAEHFRGVGPVHGSGYDALDDIEPFDLLINATSLSLQGELPPVPASALDGEARLYDMMYGNQDTVFMRWGRSMDLAVSGGFGMLIEQAAEAFEIWEGVRPKTRLAAPRLRHLLRPTE